MGPLPATPLLACLLAAFALEAQAQKGLPYPEGPLTADQVAEQVHAAAHGALVRNAVSRRTGDVSAMVVNRAPVERRGGERKPNVQFFDTFVNNAAADPEVDSLQMAILTSGKARGTGLLFTSYTDPARKATITMWLPALRRIRKLNEPSYDDVWFGTNLTYGEIVLRRPEDETHELLGAAVLEDCLPAMELETWEVDRYTENLPAPQCGHKGRPTYRLKSTTKFQNWWYDYHVSDIDRESFALYRTVYYKGEEEVKTVVIDWQSLGEADPRITYPRYIYAVTHADGTDSLVFVPRETIALNVDLADDFWSEETLKTYGQ